MLKLHSISRACIQQAELEGSKNTTISDVPGSNNASFVKLGGPKLNLSPSHNDVITLLFKQMQYREAT